MTPDLEVFNAATVFGYSLQGFSDEYVHWDINLREEIGIDFQNDDR